MHALGDAHNNRTVTNESTLSTINFKAYGH